MKILAIGAHPDDIEIFMFGLLTILKEKGNQIFTAIATDGSLGGKVTGDALKCKRKVEAKLGLKTLSKPIFLDILDGQLGDDPVHQKKIKKMIYHIMPDLILTHSEHDYHSDHRALSSLVKNAVSHYVPILYCDTLMGIRFQPNYYVDITKYFHLKKIAILKHKSQKPQKFVNLSKLMNSYRSAQCNSPLGTYAEAYFFEPSFPFSDIRNILPSSPKLNPFINENQFGFL